MAAQHQPTSHFQSTHAPAKQQQVNITCDPTTITMVVCPGCLKVGIWSYDCTQVKPAMRKRSRPRALTPFPTRQLPEGSVCEASQLAIKRQRTQLMWSPNTETSESELSSESSTSESDADDDETALGDPSGDTASSKPPVSRSSA
ncbi:hypothetical protein H310_03302 [Aphanomyces invadans]|uniref:Uncharacterized protein n=1 Tax=Aphanomyces invadans TaxID=157072 RepID=A0A024UI59_9STRA|nr:hypothetical protein H310_03302 [Aphanomyces invadans]ETW05552.1 hypothetical protein H310_03302 [Aphanomyces invadans]|eukprot:XP_008865329.1 hypothetical protein H310_03302 [Aphanomyces invadans]